jgi:hypothetical protein
MSNFLVIGLCLIAGVLCKRLRQFPAASAQALNSFIIYLSLPALVLFQIPKLLGSNSLAGAWWIPVSMAWLHFALAFVFFSWLGKRFHWSPQKRGALILVGGLGNTSFVGLPLLEALLGREAIPVGILVDQAGSFLVLSTLGIIVAAACSGDRVSVGAITKKVMTFPPLISLIVAAIWGVLGTPGAPVLFPMLEKIASTLVPLALFAVGLQLRFDARVLRKRWVPLSLGLAFKLFLAPAFFAVLYLQVVGNYDFATHVTVLEAAMASMITSAVVVAEFRLDAELANLMVGIGIPLSLLTVPIWEHFLKT